MYCSCLYLCPVERFCRCRTRNKAFFILIQSLKDHLHILNSQSGLLDDSKNAKDVASFFDDHSEEYQRKYSKNDTFYKYFFFERLQKATEDFDFNGRKILDVGSGTGGLYDYLNERGDNFELFEATDISDGMLSKSNLPKSNKHVGDILDIELNKSYDFIFMLGVTTYIEPSHLAKQFSKLFEHLSEQGHLIVTYTNRSSLDIWLRKILLPLARLFASRNRILSQSFETYFHTSSSFARLLPVNLKAVKRKGLNHTFFPVSRITPKTSVFLASCISRFPESMLKSFLSSDIILECKKEKK